jgi:hypothetical protein
MIDPLESNTPLTATYTLTVDGEPVVIRTVGSALRFLSENRCVEWTEHQDAYDTARLSLERAASNAIMSHAATNALRVLLTQSKLI